MIGTDLELLIIALALAAVASLGLVLGAALAVAAHLGHRREGGRP